MKDAYLPFMTAIGFGLIALVASMSGAKADVLTLIGTLAGYVLGRTAIPTEMPLGRMQSVRNRPPGV